MGFKVGDKVIHCTFGLGEITRIEKKTINNHKTKCFVVQLADMTIWIPSDDQQSCLRVPTPPEKFIEILPILYSPNEDLLPDRQLRKDQLMEQLKDGKLTSICRVVRDLTYYQRNTKLNDQEKSILERAVKSLVTEWTFSMGIPKDQALTRMESMLHG